MVSRRTCVVSWIFRRDHPSRPKAMICCFFSSFKTFAMSREATYPPAAVNVLDVACESMAAFQGFMYGRFWVFTEAWTMPVQNRLDMALTGIKTPVGMKLQGTNLEQIQQLGAQVQRILSGLPQVRSVFAERVSQGFYINVEVNRPEAAKYGLTIADGQQAGESGVGGMNV